MNNGRVSADLDLGVLIISSVSGGIHKPIRAVETPLSYSPTEELRSIILAAWNAQPIKVVHIRVPHVAERKRILRQMLGEVLRQRRLPLGPLAEQKDRANVQAPRWFFLRAG